MPAQHRKQKRQRSQRRRRQGGGNMSTSDWGVKAYGAANNQTTVPGSGNLIAVNPNIASMKGGSASPVVAANPPIAVSVTNTKGGSRKQGGKGVLLDVAVPAVLLYANNTFKKRKTLNKRYKKNFSRKFRRH